jgi:phage terminase small subunit
MARKGEMSPQHKAFADEYLSNGYNVLQAALSAGYSESYARVDAYRLLQSPRVKAYIDAKMKPIIEARTLKVDEAVAMISDIAMGKENKDGKTPSDNTRLKALDMLMRANCQYTDKVEVSGDIDVASILKKAKGRADKAKASSD